MLDSNFHDVDNDLISHNIRKTDMAENKPGKQSITSKTTDLVALNSA